MGALDIRQAVHADLPALIRSLGQETYFTDRLARQDAGHGFLLIAWDEEVAVGDVYVWLAPAEEPELRALLPGVALLTHLEVAAGRRNEGIGTELLRAAEQRLAAINHTKVALGVGLDNPGAQRLYQRRGYVEWRYGPVATTDVVYHPNGRHELRPELCRILIKPLNRTHHP
ncbi:Ribosomal protein S18 acetylase RimI [Nonomuraea solani]|uniref:Ribosomal protein S18 acetylase RimI n=1 Tax=Nonomuraea solani TaxID=1144553 RepID=A0A1H6B8F2_9ACTN|nr:GNAT family N-acetyltransferase [Nonomuraea solani]SEG57119.1 Ribosomal protein S18 acetylase RimI [Nonomuraea solani]